MSRTQTAAAAVVATALGALYLDKRFAITPDLRELRYERAFGRQLQKRLGELGDTATIYNILRSADQDAEALWFEQRTWSYRLLLQDVDRLAAVLYGHGIVQGTRIAVMTTNSPEMVLTICALSRLGALPALINTSLRRDTLRHCLDVCNAAVVIATPDLVPHLPNGNRISLNVGSSGPLDVQLTGDDRVKQLPSDTGLLMYTSGTTGRPKAIRVKNFIFIVTSTPLPQDLENPRKYSPARLYSCLSLFHGTCLLGGLMYSMGTSATFCLSRKFSASRFARELHDCRATRMLYIGELCRYLLRAPPSPYDRSHSCRMAYGNGLRPEVWIPFQKRFNIPEIREIYRSTEGVARFDNFTHGPAGSGNVGRTGLIRKYREKTTYLVRYDQTTQAPFRDPETGFCVLAKAGEPGEAIGRVLSMNFYNEYLSNPDANEEKLIRDVFSKGDVFQRSGDLLVRQPDGWIRFCERSGDTYRWKGENVSAGEVREHIARIGGVHDVSVFSESLENYDGQAGAAEIVLNRPGSPFEISFMRSLAPKLRKSGLAGYQLPRLVRVSQEIESTATFKRSKAQRRETWDPSAASQTSRLYWLDGRAYESLDEKSWKKIANGSARL